MAAVGILLMFTVPVGRSIDRSLRVAACSRQGCSRHSLTTSPIRPDARNQRRPGRTAFRPLRVTVPPVLKPLAVAFVVGLDDQRLV